MGDTKLTSSFTCQGSTNLGCGGRPPAWFKLAT